VQPGHADDRQPLDDAAEELGAQRSLVGHGLIRGAGRHDQDRAFEARHAR
jgi:hypothetical protein